MKELNDWQFMIVFFFAVLGAAILGMVVGFGINSFWAWVP